jgi:MFS family permease
MAETPLDAPTAKEVLADRSVKPFLGAIFLSTLALLSQETALLKLVFDLTRRELDLGWVGLVEFLPVALLVVVAGPVADRFDRRLIARIGWVAQAVPALALAWLADSRPSTILPILGVVLVFGIARAFQNPATRALPANVVDLRSLPRLSALYSLAWQSGIIAGPVIGGVLYAVDPALPFVFTAGALVVAAAMLSVVHTRQEYAVRDPAAVPTPAQRVREAVEGLSVIRRTPILLGAISLDLFAVLFGGAVALLPVIAEERLGVGAVGYAWLRAAGGIGAAGMAAVMALRPVRRHIGRTLFAVVGIFGAATVVMGATRTYAVAFVAMVVLSAADAVSVFIRSTLSPLVVADAWRGRVLAVEAVFIGASNELGAFESGVVGQWLGAPLAIVAGGLCTIAIVGAGVGVFPSLRRVDRFEDLRPSPG